MMIRYPRHKQLLFGHYKWAKKDVSGKNKITWHTDCGRNTLDSPLKWLGVLVNVDGVVIIVNYI